MKGARKAATGFTLIEVVLFFAIAGLMMIGIFAAANNGINNQRYSTAVASLQSYFQDQYSQVANVHNDRPTSQQCTSAGVGSGGITPTVGASDCMIIGRFITTNVSAKTLTSTPVYALNDIAAFSSGDPCRASDANAFKSTCLNLVTDSSEATNYTLEWDTALLTKATPASTTFNNLAIFIYRSPIGGQLSFMWTTIGQTLPMLLTPGNAQTGSLMMCVDQSGWTTIPRMGVLIDTTTAGSSNAVSRVLGGSGC